MADRTPLTPAEIARRMRIPEEDPNYVNDPYRAMLAPLLVYGGALGRFGGVAKVAEAAAPKVAAAAPAAREAFTYAFPRQLAPEEIAAMRAAFSGAGPETGASLSLMDRLRSALTTSSRAANPSRVVMEASAPMPSTSETPSAGAGRGFVVEQPGERYAGTIGAGRGSADYYPTTVQSAPRPTVQRDIPLPPSRDMQAQARAAQPTDSLFSKIFSGKDYQSNAELVNKPMGGAPVNWGNSENTADFFRAEKALRAQRPEMFERQAEARGGAPKAAGNGGKDAALHKALEIIHHLLTRGR